MTAIQRMRIAWTGFPGGPGVSSLYFTDAAAAQEAVRAFLTACAPAFPLDVTMTVEASGETIEDTTGKAVATWAGTLQAPVVGVQNAAYASGVGILARWYANEFVNGRRVRGRMFLVPVANSCYDQQGNISTATLGTVTTAATDLISGQAGFPLIWSRPVTATPAWTDKHGHVHPATPSRLGSSHAALIASVASKVAILRSRRD